MSEQRKSKGQTSDFSAARARLKDIGEGLGGVFDTMSKLIEEAASQDGAKTPRERVKSSFDVRVTTLDALSEARSRPSAGRRSQPKPRQPQPKNAQPEKPKPPQPLDAELHETEDGFMVVVTLGAASSDTITICKDAGAVVLAALTWTKRFDASKRALDSIDWIGIQRVERNGFLTFYLQRHQTPHTHTKETQE